MRFLGALSLLVGLGACAAVPPERRDATTAPGWIAGRDLGDEAPLAEQRRSLAAGGEDGVPAGSSSSGPVLRRSPMDFFGRRKKEAAPAPPAPEPEQKTAEFGDVATGMVVYDVLEQVGENELRYVAVGSPKKAFLSYRVKTGSTPIKLDEQSAKTMPNGKVTPLFMLPQDTKFRPVHNQADELLKDMNKGNTYWLDRDFQQRFLDKLKTSFDTMGFKKAPASEGQASKTQS